MFLVVPALFYLPEVNQLPALAEALYPKTTGPRALLTFEKTNISGY